MRFLADMCDTCWIQDGLLPFRPRKRAIISVGDIRFCDLASLRSRFEPAPAMWRLNEGALLAHNLSEEKVFRCAPAQDSDRLCSDPELPRRTAPTPEVLPESWKELTGQEAEARVLDGGSLLVLGNAGVGKTHFLRGIVERLRAAGKLADVISKTHIASKRADGTTADRWVRRHILHGTCTYDVLWVD